MGDLKQELIAKMTGLSKSREPTISDVQKETESMDVIDKAMGTARKLAGTDTLAEELKNKDKKMEELGKANEKIKEELHETRMEIVQKELGGKIENLAELIKAGGTRKSISDQISEIKKTADELGLGGSKVSELRDMMNLIESLRPNKGLVEQVKEARDLLTSLQPEGKKESLVEGMPAEVTIQLKKMESDLKITLEKMADERQERAQNFQITMKRWEEDGEMKKQEIEGKIAVERDRNELLAGGIETIGKAIGRGYWEAGQEAIAPQGGISQKQQSQAKSYTLKLDEGESGEFDCPNCHAKVGVGPTSTVVRCVGCNSQFPITRALVAAPSEPAPVEEE